MKKSLFLFCFFLVTIQFVNGQKNDPATKLSLQALHDEYLQTSKTYKKVGWIMFGGGLGMTAIGTSIYLSQALQDRTQTTAGPLFFYLGAATTVLSVPFLISAGSNKRKAELLLKPEPVFFGNKSLDGTNYTALALKIPI